MKSKDIIAAIKLANTYIKKHISEDIQWGIDRIQPDIGKHNISIEITLRNENEENKFTITCQPGTNKLSSDLESMMINKLKKEINKKDIVKNTSIILYIYETDGSFKTKDITETIRNLVIYDKKRYNIRHAMTSGLSQTDMDKKIELVETMGSTDYENVIAIMENKEWKMV